MSKGPSREADFWATRKLPVAMLRSLRAGTGPTMNKIAFGLIATLIALLAAAAPVEAASCNGASHQLALSNGTTTPGSVTLGAPMTFTVTYTDTADCAPTAITLNIGGVGTFPMNAGGTTYSAGVTYWITLTLPAGSHPYAYAATSGSGRGERTVTLSAVDPLSALVVVPPPPPPPPAPATTPPPPPPATPAPPPPTPAPAAAAPIAPMPPASAPPTSTHAATATPAPSASPSAAASPLLGLIDSHDSWSPAPVEPVSASVLGRQSMADAALMIGSLVALVGLVAFVVLAGRRRREPSPVAVAAAAEVTSAVAVSAESAAGATQPATGKVTPLPPMRELIPPVDPDLLRDDELDEVSEDDARLPRWLRTDVRSARRGPNELRSRNWH